MDTSNVTLFDVIALVESNRNFGAIRFEPKVYAEIASGKFANYMNVSNILYHIMRANYCSLGTAWMIYASSWGAVQLMGFNIYGGERPYSNSLSEFLNNETDQRAHFISFLDSNHLLDVTPEMLAMQPDQRLHFAIKYNGSIDYVERIESVLKRLGFSIKN